MGSVIGEGGCEGCAVTDAWKDVEPEEYASGRIIHGEDQRREKAKKIEQVASPPS